MGFFKEVTNTMKNIFSADDDMMFEDENDFIENKNLNVRGLPKISFGKKKDEREGKGPLPIFSANNHDFNFAQAGGIKNNKKSNGRIQIYVPKTFEEAFNIIKDVRDGYTAMVNVEVANPQIAQRIVDLVSGAIYVLDGECKKMGEKQYIFSLSAETIGAYDYLPVNGNMNRQNPSSEFNFNMGMPFNFLNQGQNINQPMFNQPNFGNQQVFNQQIDGMQFQNNQRNVDAKSFYVPPTSQF